MPPKNRAAWFPAKKVRPFKVDDAPYTPPGPGEVVIKNGAVAINPFDWLLQYIGHLILPFLKFPTIIGTDVAGTVVEIGVGVDRFQVGDRVCGQAICINKVSGKASEGAFQLYTVVREHLIAPVPAHITDEQASVLGLGLATAATSLFHKDWLALDFPTVPRRPNPPKEGARKRAVIITGGASSVGSNAVQLASQAGYEVLTTASPKNIGYLQGLGATHVFDYRSKTLVDDLLKALEGRDLVGAVTLGEGSFEACTAVMKRRRDSSGATRKFIAMAGNDLPQQGSRLDGRFGVPLVMLSIVWGFMGIAASSLFSGVPAKFVDIGGGESPDSVVAKLYAEFLPQALAERQFVPSPEPLVVGKGLEVIQEAMEVQRNGVSAKKVVVSL
ncbi:GroES-like protein [Thozetella sp. PMI_491]|nr:GroES-like protein [Thozetella sp. PMI_491]